MAAIDEFATGLLEEAKRFLENAQETVDVEARAAYCHAALMLGFCALEAHVNAVADDFSTRPELSAHEKSILLEKDVRLESGEFSLKKSLKMYRLEDRIEFLHRRFSGEPVDRSQTWWGNLARAIDLRNQLTHPKSVPNVDEPSVKSALQAIVDVLDAIYQGIYKRRFPPAVRGVQSKCTF